MSRYKIGHKQPRFRYSVLARCVAWANISVQVLFPLAVTFTPVMAARAQHAVQPRLSMENTTVAADNNVEKNVASFAANAGTFLSSQPDSDATRNFITGMATAKANQEIQEWLGKYGTARVKLNVDKDFSLKDSSLEMLYPIYDTPTNMLFTQGAIHRTDDRTQSNIGFGWRHFSGNDWMAGVNTFIDHDLSRSHTRIGVGAEYWRDYLKLSANGYIRASGWKKSPDVEDYQERPANGWDIRVQMLANGNEQKPLVLSLRDAEGQPVTGMKDQIKTELTFKPAGNIVTRSLKATKSQAKPTLGEFTETEAGVYQSVFTTGTQSGEATITVSVDDMSKTVTAELRATMMDVANSTLSANEPSGDVVADGQQAYTLTLTAVDSEGNPVTGEASRLRLVPQDTNGVTVGAISEIKPGVYSATVSSTRAGNVVVRAFSEQYQLGTLQQTLKFVAGPLDAAHSSITLNPDKPVVGGTVTAIWTAKDAYDNPVTSLTPEAP